MKKNEDTNAFKQNQFYYMIIKLLSSAEKHIFVYSFIRGKGVILQYFQF